MLKKVRILSLSFDFGLIFEAVWGVWGVAEFKLRLQADFNLGFTRPAPQAGVRRIEHFSKIRPGGDQWPLIPRFWAFWNDEQIIVFS